MQNSVKLENAAVENLDENIVKGDLKELVNKTIKKIALELTALEKARLTELLNHEIEEISIPLDASDQKDTDEILEHKYENYIKDEFPTVELSDSEG